MIWQVTAAVAVPVAVVCGLLLRRRFGGAAVVTGAAASVSLAVTVDAWVVGQWAEADRLPTLLGLADLVVLPVLVAVVVRTDRSRCGPAAAVAASAAVTLWPSRFQGAVGPGDTLALIGFGAVLLVPAVLAGGYLRALDERRRKSVTAARRTQRLELAHDLHDFVAHDVSGMVALAQAGTVLASADPARAAMLFERIESAGQLALTSLDRTVRLLRADREDGSEDGEDDGAERRPQPGLDDLPALVERFAGAGSAEVRLDVPVPTVDVSRETAATAYRIVVEALTNVRRHSPGARTVDVQVRRVGGQLDVTVTDDGTGAPTTGVRRGGNGLAGLTARVEALGGSLTAGRQAGTGWQLVATIPVGVAR
ncbi:ATP-binding protein [Kitasatospora sp. NPDC051914]|uniref:sensor histidine kinase n=1 Tax=Kitasatospora sp. NPDC051914 TaxID=3154945 RepID=UPI0034494403